MPATFSEAYRTNQFVVEIAGIESPAVTKVTGLTEGEVEAIEQADGGTGHIHKISSGIVKFGDLTLERNLDGTVADTRFQQWFSTMFAVDGSGGGSSLRRDGSVVVKQSGEEVARWCFEGAWIKSSKFSDLDAGTSSLLKQTVVLAVERMYRP
jgi:phage tail-like protein